MTVSCSDACLASMLGAGVKASSAAAPRAAYCAASGGWLKNASYLARAAAGGSQAPGIVRVSAACFMAPSVRLQH